MIIGIDLAGKAGNPTGVCILNESKLKFKTLYKNRDILNEIYSIDPSLISIDAPLSLPEGRCCLEKDCPCAVGGHFRKAERDIRPYGPVLPLTFQGMKMLTLRGIILVKELKKDYRVIETHPRTCQKILGLEDPFHDLSKIFTLPTNISIHELDALLAALAGFLYLKDYYIELGDISEGTIIIPKKHALKQLLMDLLPE